MLTGGRVADVAVCARPKASDTFGLQGHGPVGAAAASPRERGRGRESRAGGRYQRSRRLDGQEPIPPVPWRQATTSPPCRLGPEESGRGPYLYSSPAPEPRLRAFSTPRARTIPPLQARTGTRRGGNAESHHSPSSRQQQTRRRSTAWPRAGSEGDGHLSGGGRPREPERRSAGRPVSRSVTRAERAIQTATNPGTSRRGALGATGRPEERSDGERAGPRRWRGPRSSAKASPVPDGRKRARPTT
jgi:hypothetical protein